jgi:5-methyltetrahydrofolate--homocysteine methyltransferase
LRDSLVSFNSEKVQQACREALEMGMPPYEIISGGIAKGTEIIGTKFQAGDFYLSDLIMAGETVKEAMKILEPTVLATNAPEETVGRVMIGTVEGDMHDIGKSIVKMFLQASSFSVIDLGVDVSAKKFIDGVSKNKPDILGMSGLMTISMDQMKAVMNRLRKSQLRDRIKVIIGGAPITSSYAGQIGADEGTNDAVQGVETMKRWVARH